jgi:hypothetical protein
MEPGQRPQILTAPASQGLVIRPSGQLHARIALLVVVFLATIAAPARATVINFDALSDLDSVTTQFSGLTFSNTTVATAGITLNEFEFPPRSSPNVVFDDGGAISIVFGALQFSVGGFFTYTTPLTFTAFDRVNGVVGSDTSNFGSNLALSGDPGSSPNEFLGVTFAGGIRKVTIQGDPAGTSFTLDDLTFATRITAVPGAPAVVLVGLGLASLIGWRRIREFRNKSP